MSQIVCRECQRSLRYSHDLRGKKVHCPQCKTLISIPLLEMEKADDPFVETDLVDPLLGEDPLAGTSAVTGNTSNSATESGTSHRGWLRNKWTWAAAFGGVLIFVGILLQLIPKGPKGAFEAYTRALNADEWGRIYDMSGKDERERIHQQIDRYLKGTRPRPTFAEGLSRREQFIEISKRTRSKRLAANSSVPQSVQAAKRAEYFRSMKVVRVEYLDANQTAMVVYVSPTTAIKEKRTKVSDELYQVESRSRSKTYASAVEKRQFFAKEDGEWKFVHHQESAGDINAIIF